VGATVERPGHPPAEQALSRGGIGRHRHHRTCGKADERTVATELRFLADTDLGQRETLGHHEAEVVAVHHATVVVPDTPTHHVVAAFSVGRHAGSVEEQQRRRRAVARRLALQ
jgi:hypothetical protein